MWFHLSCQFSAGCAGGRCRRRARPGKEAEGRLPLRVLGYYSTGLPHCKVKFYDLDRIFRLFPSVGQKFQVLPPERGPAPTKIPPTAVGGALGEGTQGPPPPLARLRLERRDGADVSRGYCTTAPPAGQQEISVTGRGFFAALPGGRGRNFFAKTAFLHTGFSGATRPRTPGPLLDAQKWAEKPLGRPQTSSFCPIGLD